MEKALSLHQMDPGSDSEFALLRSGRGCIQGPYSAGASASFCKVGQIVDSGDDLLSSHPSSNISVTLSKWRPL